MLDTIKAILAGIWTNHKKTILGFLLGLLFSGLALVTKIPLADIKAAAYDASKPDASAPAVPAPFIAPAPAAAPQPAPVPLEEK